MVEEFAIRMVHELVSLLSAITSLLVVLGLFRWFGVSIEIKTVDRATRKPI
jgi:hypothetical protein